MARRLRNLKNSQEIRNILDQASQDLDEENEQIDNESSLLENAFQEQIEDDEKTKDPDYVYDNEDLNKVDSAISDDDTISEAEDDHSNLDYLGNDDEVLDQVI